ncbi:DUF1553 domain-containing protein [Roseimaritima ulvae]|uniref:DUF1553 domain-containing protein n=1 Tax=Roseimaritima ulvae TaxID=980254 RepID=A0A5B9R2G5_9BACT|nr:DUF1553 domain-containing protein [Roseimaritima ulvae]QEG43596.1 hypothetical protein UC8_56470 [Roseimaritima ulvae]
MRTFAACLWFGCCSLIGLPGVVQADSRGDELARWLNERGQEVFGPLPQPCDDLTFARRLYLDILGRVPSVSELRDFQSWGENRRNRLIDQLVFGEGARADTYKRLSAQQFARQWRRVLLPPGTTVVGSPEPLEAWLREAFANQTAFDQIMQDLIRLETPVYYQQLGSLPENYAAQVSRVALGVRLECTQCHDHPFVDWKQQDFWGIAAFYSDASRSVAAPNASQPAAEAGSIRYEGMEYPAKFLWSDAPLEKAEQAPRTRLAHWVTAADNPHFSAVAVNRFWQHLVGRGWFADVENFDLATPDQRRVLDEFGQRFADSGFNIDRLTAAICKSAWYQAESGSPEDVSQAETFVRTLKVNSPEQVFDSLEQSLLLPISRIDPTAPRWSGDRIQLVSRLSETTGATPEDYASGIPQALLLMNGKITSDAIDLQRSRLLRAVLDSPFFNQRDRIETLYLAVLTRRPTTEEQTALAHYLESQDDDAARQRAYGEILWALLNSPEFVLCR